MFWKRPEINRQFRLSLHAPIRAADAFSPLYPAPQLKRGRLKPFPICPIVSLGYCDALPQLSVSPRHHLIILCRLTAAPQCDQSQQHPGIADGPNASRGRGRHGGKLTENCRHKISGRIGATSPASFSPSMEFRLQIKCTIRRCHGRVSVCTRQSLHSCGALKSLLTHLPYLPIWASATI